MGMLASRYRALDAGAREELYHEAWASVLERRRDGVEIENLRGYLIGAAGNLAAKRVHGADARRRVTFDPTAGPLPAMPSASPSPEEAVLAADEARRLRMLIDELGGAERAVLKLRLDLGLDPPEIRERLGLSERQYRRVAERASRALARQCAEYGSGAWARRKRSLLSACALGVASERQRARAQELLDSDPACRAIMGELRELAGRAAAMLPMPVAAEPGLLAGVKQHVAAAYVRVMDPTPLAGARPGAVATVVAGCIAAGGGAYCAVEGVPGPVKPVLGEDDRADRAEEPAAPMRTAPEPQAAPPPVAPQPAEPSPAPPAAPPAQAPPPAPEQEFTPAPAPAAPPPAPAAPATSGGGSEFGP